VSDPIHPQAGDDPKVDGPSKHPHPLFWLLVLAALLVFGWAFYNRRASAATPAMIRPDAAPAATPAEQRAVARQPQPHEHATLTRPP